jgi:molybdopterin converting factor small subunit
MKVTVKFYSYLRTLIDQRTLLELNLDDGATISMLIDELLQDSKIKKILLDENQSLKPDITILKV